MANNREQRANLLEIALASGLAVGQEPVQTAAAAAATTVAAQQLMRIAGDVGGNLIASLSERGFQHWRKHWVSSQGIWQDDIARALGNAFGRATSPLEPV